MGICLYARGLVAYDSFDRFEWKVIYVGSAESSEYDQELESIMVGPIPKGINKFIFEVRASCWFVFRFADECEQAPSPDPSKIPMNDIIGVTVILLTCSYLSREFVRVGYYVNVEYRDEELKENPPTQIQFENLARNILADKPRVTRFPINWDKSGVEQPMPEAIAAAENEP